MMRIQLIAAALVAAACVGVQAKDTKPKAKRPTGQPTMHIRISAGAETYAMGLPIPVAVSLANDGDQPFVGEAPDSSMAVEYHQLDARTKEDLSYAMGKLTTTNFGPDQYALVTPVPKRLELAPHTAHDFTTDPNQRLYQRPGRYEAFVTMERVGKSNSIPLTISFTRASVAPLFALARDATAEYGRREWAADWLARLYPGFRIKLAAPDASEPVRTQLEADNHAVYDAFQRWWHAHESDPQLDAQLQSMQGS
jgi:hypothetical protein